MKYQLKACLLLIAHVAFGLLLLAALQQFKATPGMKADIIFLSFFLLNVLYIPLLGLKDALYGYWAIAKAPYFFLGAFAGLLLGALPLFAASAAGVQYKHILQTNNLAAGAIFLTFLITGWEELWFRSILLNYGSRHIPKTVVAILMGLLFMLLHLLNPKISLAQEGPMLFIAGVLLTALYFYYRNIWLPMGLHFGNNLFGSAMRTDIKSHSFFGSEGHIYTAVLLLAAIFFLVKLHNQRPQKGNL